MAGASITASTDPRDPGTGTARLRLEVDFQGTSHVFSERAMRTTYSSRVPPMNRRNAQTASGASLTDWSMVLDSAQTDSPTRQESLDRLVRRYWGAMLARARASGLSEHDAHDAIQGFVADVILERNMLAAADPDRGRFRGLLSRSLANYLRDRNRRRSAAKRSPVDGRVDSLLDGDAPAAGGSGGPEAAFTRHWVATVIRNAIQRVRTDFEAGDRSIEWRILEARLITPMIDGSRPVPYAALVTALSLKDVPRAASLLVTGKRALGRAILDEISQTVSDPDDVSEEIKDLLRMLEVDSR